MIVQYKYKGLAIFLLAISLYSCAPELAIRKANNGIPGHFVHSNDTTNTGRISWRAYFSDPNLIALIDTALGNNQELNIFLREIEIARNEVQARKGEYLPFMSLGAAASSEKVGRYTRSGAVEANNEIEPGREFPEPLPDFMIGAFANWEVDVWRKLRNARKAAFYRYLATREAQNFLVTNLVAEVANSYYELLAMDNQLQIVLQNIQIQSDALEIVKLQKQSARVTELAVRRFEAQVLNTRSLEFEIKQKIFEKENKINFLLGRFPQPVAREAEGFVNLVKDSVYAGIPSQLLQNRPDVRRAEQELLAANLDVAVAKANFYPSLSITAGVGLQAFNPVYLVSRPESLLLGLAGDIAAPLVNRRAIKAFYNSAGAKQVQAAFDYERTILNGYIEVSNQLSNISNLKNSYELKAQEVEALTASIDISDNLFRSARADYVEVLLTQREALEARFELIETKRRQLGAWVNVYRALGGGWQ